MITDIITNIWDFLSFFESPYNCKEFLTDRIKHDFYSINLEKLIKKKDEAKSREGLKNLVDFFPIEKKDILNLNLHKQMANCITQGKEYFQAAKVVSNYTSPVLLYYGMLSLSKALMDSTIKVKLSIKEQRHGLSIDRTGNQGNPYESVRIEKQGFFPRFFITYVDQKEYGIHFKKYNDTSYHEPARNFDEILNHIENKTYFSFKQLLYSIVPIHGEYIVFYMDSKRGYVPPKIKDCLDEISSCFLLMYMLSQLARYRPQTWVEFLRGEERGGPYLINNFLKTSITYYPELIYNELTAKSGLRYFDDF